jgi:hypothetical protein
MSQLTNQKTNMFSVLPFPIFLAILLLAVSVVFHAQVATQYGLVFHLIENLCLLGSVLCFSWNLAMELKKTPLENKGILPERFFSGKIIGAIISGALSSFFAIINVTGISSYSEDMIHFGVIFTAWFALFLIHADLLERIMNAQQGKEAF